ncbi:MAG: mechanosensitive ion channel [Planctomycetia bacterium]|nr:mechanosensitive ion channel [Planctomycetia bacterium]
MRRHEILWIAFFLCGYFWLHADLCCAQNDTAASVVSVEGGESVAPEGATPEGTTPETPDDLAGRLFDAPQDETTDVPAPASEEEIPEDKKPLGLELPLNGSGAHNESNTKPNSTPNAEEMAEGSTQADEGAKKNAPHATPIVDPLRLEKMQNLRSPRETVRFFLNSALAYHYEDAMLAMDFSKQPELTDIQKQDLAFKLLGILSRLDNFYLRAIPEDYPQKTFYLHPDKNYHAIQFVKQDDGTWQFGAATIVDIPRFYAQIQSKAPSITKNTWMRRLPESFFLEYYGLTLFQWLVVGIFILVGIGAARLTPVLITPLIMFGARFLRGEKCYATLLKRALRPMSYFVMLYIWLAGFRFVQVSPLILRYAGFLIHPLGVFLLMITLMRMVDVFSLWTRQRLKRSNNKIGNVIVEFASGILKFLVISLCVIAIIQIFGFSAWGVISGMGIGGIAVALAAQQTISNVFGSLTILMDRPFSVGDHIISGTIEGTVETVGLRSTCIRTFYDSCVFIPNSTLASSTIDNMSRREYRRFLTTLALQYDTPVVLLKAFVAGVREILENEESVRREDICVRVTNLSASSVDVLVRLFLRVDSYLVEQEMREKLILNILNLAEHLGVSFAFPTQTNYMIESKPNEYPLASQMPNDRAAEACGKTLAQQVCAQNKE